MAGFLLQIAMPWPRTELKDALDYVPIDYVDNQASRP
jgi:hypothetical protein